MKSFFCIIIFGVFFQNCRQGVDKIKTDFPGKPQVPEIILTEHKLLLSVIDSLALLKDSTGVVALKLKEVMRHHFEEEEDYVLPALGLLPFLSRDSVPAKSGEVISLTEKLKTQRDHISAEHQLITAFLKELTRVAKEEGHGGLDTFHKAVLNHAEAEEAIYFPAAIVVGEYLKLKTK